MEYFRQFAAVAGVLATLAAALWWLRSRGWAGTLPATRNRRRLECLERLPLGPQQSVHLLRAGERLMLVSSSPSGCALIANLSAGDFGDPPGGAR